MAKKSCHGQFMRLNSYFRSLRHPIFAIKSPPSHKELLKIAEDHFKVSFRGTKQEQVKQALELLPPLPSHTVKTAKKAKTPRYTPYNTSPTFSIDFIVSDAFLESYEWRRLRYSVIKDHNGCCSLCGRGRPHGAILNVDHIKPRRKYPELALVADNLQVLCHDCNHGKGNWDETDWR